MKLVIGNKQFSSWSLRPWLLLRQLGVPFDEVLVRLYNADTRARIRALSPSGKVPALVLDSGEVVWDSLAIVETLHELLGPGRVWPTDFALRAHGRSICCEMHSGFAAMRTHLSMNVALDASGKSLPDDALADVARVFELLGAALGRSGGPFLLGTFSAADAFFAPVVSRFVTYGVAVPDELRAYTNLIWSLPAMQEWVAAGRAEAAPAT
jgi:glutathione S-transferase